jgi:hypothetical protein
MTDAGQAAALNDASIEAEQITRWLERHADIAYKWGFPMVAWRAVLADRRRLAAELEEITDLDRSALKHQELKDERARAVRMWHNEKKRADQAEARVAELGAELTAMHDEAGYATARIRELEVELGTEVQWGIRVHIVDEVGDRGSHVLTGYTEGGARYRAYAEFEHAEPVFRRLGEWQPAPDITEADDA